MTTRSQDRVGTGGDVRADAIRAAVLEAPSPEESRAAWLRHRLGAMEPAELVDRSRGLLKVQGDLLGLRRPARGLSGAAGRLPRLDPGREPAIVSHARARLVAVELPDGAQAALRAARPFAAGSFRFLGYEPATLARPIDFDLDPFTGRRWPLRHGLLIDYRSSEVGDPKWSWELNRLQHVPLMLAAGLIGGDERLIDTALGDAAAWLRQSVPGRGIAWSNAYEPALRAISLALTLDAVRGLATPAGLGEALLGSLGAHVAWIRRYPSLNSSANNHRLGELAGLLFAALIVPELALEPVADEALRELQTRLAEQFAPDGTHREQAFGYTVFAVELILVVAGALLGAGRELPRRLEALLERICGALHAQLGDGEPEPRYGDRDDGGPTLLGASRARSGRSALASLRYALGERAEHVREVLDPATVWLLGGSPAARRGGRARSPQQPPGSVWLRDGGIVLLRRGRTTVGFDVGPLGFGSLAAHGHADALQVTVAHAGRAIVGDPGTGSYFGHRGVRAAFRGTGFHATVLVDGRDQAEAGGPFLWRTQPRVDVELVDLEQRRACAGHDGYRRLEHPVAHGRSVRLIAEGLVLVHDRLTGDGAHSYSQRWPLHPETTVDWTSEDTVFAALGGGRLELTTVCSAACRLAVRVGETDPMAGWWSDGLESVRPAPLVCFDVASAPATELVTLLALDSDQPAAGRPRLEVDWGARRCAVRRSRRSWVIALDPPAAGTRPGATR